MESLALAVSLVLATMVVVAVAALWFSPSKSPVTLGLGAVFALAAIALGMNLLLAVDSVGARVFGATATTAGVLGAARVVVHLTRSR